MYLLFISSFSVARVSHDGAQLNTECGISVTRGIRTAGIQVRGSSGRRETVVDESRKETADRVARYQTDYVVGRT